MGGSDVKIVVLPVTVHVRKICHTCTTVACCNAHFFTKYSIFNSALIHYHYLVVVVITFVILSNIVISCHNLFLRTDTVTCRGIEKSPEQNPIDSGAVLQTVRIDYIHYDVLL